MWLKLATFLISNPRLVLKILAVVVFGFLLLLLLLIAPFVLLVGAPLAPPSMIDIYIQGTDRAEQITADGYYGKLEIDPMDVLALSAALREQDFSSASVRRTQNLASNFVEKTGYRDKKVGYENDYDEEGNIVGQTAVYETFPVYRIKSLDEVAAALGLTGEKRLWVVEMRGGDRQFTNIVGVGSGAALNWWTEVRHIFPRGMEVSVTDVTTGRSFRVRRTGGRNHADSEPVTVLDAMTIFDIWGGWSWNRRPVIVEIGGRFVAASMNGMPHGFDTIRNNGMQGHVCIHFRHSQTHVANRECVEHQAMVLRASGFVYDHVSQTADVYDFAPDQNPESLQ